MSQKLIGRSPDLKHLRDEGYEVEVRSGFLLVHSVPYLNSLGEIKRGTLISSLTMSGDVTTRPDGHVVQFAGEYPCNLNGSEISQIKHGAGLVQVAPGIPANFSFSNKPPHGFANYYEKMHSYVTIISAPAKAKDPSVDAKTFKVVESDAESSVFVYMDTASSRAGIASLAARVSSHRLAIVGLGGTGSYILDLVAKTSAKEIHLFDDDQLFQHNAFRAPGAASIEELRQQKFKVDYFASKYQSMRSGIIPHVVRITEVNLHILRDFEFVFICIDDGTARKLITNYLVAYGISFIDAGMGVELTPDAQRLWAVCRITVGAPNRNSHLPGRLPVAPPNEDDLYAQNIQIADLNALNAVMAVIKWKKIAGIYEDIESEFHSTYSTNLNLLTSDEKVP